MGIIKLKAVIGDAKRERLREEFFIADSGAFNSVIPPRLAEELKLPIITKTKVTLANGRLSEAAVSVIYVKLLDREGEFLAWILETPEPLLGATVFEGLGLMIDPSTGEVKHSRSFGLAAL